MILILLLSAALQNAEPCSPRMLPMVTTSLPYSGPDGEVAGLIVDDEDNREITILFARLNEIAKELKRQLKTFL